MIAVVLIELSFKYFKLFFFFFGFALSALFCLGPFETCFDQFIFFFQLTLGDAIFVLDVSVHTNVEKLLVLL